MNLSERLGRLQYLRGKSQWYLETVRAWITPAAAAGAYVKYLGFSTTTSLLVALLLPAVVEAFGYLLGRFLWEGGGVETEYRMAMERDPWKMQTLVRLTKIQRLLELARGKRASGRQRRR